MKIREWLIKKIVGDKPVIMNVTLILDQPIKASEIECLFHRANVEYSQRLESEWMMEQMRKDFLKKERLSDEITSSNA